jgi:methyl-accepting chemotaxis protein
VVADEVRRLAERSQGVGGRHRQGDRGRPVGVQRHRGQHGAQRPTDAGGLSLLGEVADATAKVRLTTQQQRSATEQVVVTMAQISSSSGQMSATAHQIASSADQLASLAADLERTAESAGEPG